MSIPSIVIPYINILILIFVAVSIFLGYRKGLLYQIFTLLAVLTAILVSWFFAPVVAKTIDIYPRIWTPFVNTAYGTIFYDKLNTLAWYAILFIVIVCLFLLLKPFAKALMELPILHTVNHLLGAVFSLLPTAVMLVFMAYFLSTPLITNGKDVIEQTAFKPIRNASVNVISLLEEPYAVNEAIQKLTNDPMSLTDQDIERLMKWLISENDNNTEPNIQDFLNEHSATGE